MTCLDPTHLPSQWSPSGRRGAAKNNSDDHLTRDDVSERALILRAKAGEPQDREQVVKWFAPMIGGVARAYRRSTAVDHEELMQEGVVGLLRALERYDPERGVPFWAYAVWWVRQAMQQVVSELSRPMVLSDRALRQLARVKDAQRRFEQAHRHEPCPSELASLVGLPRWQVESLFRAERNARGLDEPVFGEPSEGTSLAELLADDPAEEEYERVDQRELARTVPTLLAYLNERERTVIRSRYGLGRPTQTLREVAPKLGVSAERVRQIEHDALEKLYSAATG
ncbi:MAG TPA: sigma-70 family RNA polymerase sigma factor [Acidimicrobiales bacterium]|nr:sigma-70 family RNA polymerase sigma factor [Acidimicrobiales bacterium]